MHIRKTYLRKKQNMNTNIYYLHTQTDPNILITIHNLLKHTQQTQILSLTFFGTYTNQPYHSILQDIKQAVYTILNRKIPITFIPEQTISSQELWVEVWEHSLSNTIFISHESTNGTHYLHIKDQQCEMLCIEGIPSSNHSLPISQQSTDIFSKLQSILYKHNFTIGDIIRQWNYIGNITGCNNNEQIYQIYNNSRSQFYQKSLWPNGYPAATGIGAQFNGLIVSCIALKSINSNSQKVYPLNNPLQIAAHSYSKEVLIGSTQTSLKETPKFERAKLIDFANNIYCFISGTASIRGEYSTHIQSPKKQTELTLSNIEYLISSENLRQNSCPNVSLKICNLRVYIKNKAHYQIIRETVEERFPSIPTIYLFTDICRQELLVEIEGVCQLSQ